MLLFLALLIDHYLVVAGFGMSLLQTAGNLISSATPPLV